LSFFPARCYAPHPMGCSRPDITPSDSPTMYPLRKDARWRQALPSDGVSQIPTRYSPVILLALFFKEPVGAVPPVPPPFLSPAFAAELFTVSLARFPPPLTRLQRIAPLPSCSLILKHSLNFFSNALYKISLPLAMLTTRRESLSFPVNVFTFPHAITHLKRPNFLFFFSLGLF